MGTLFVDKLDPQSGTSLEIGSSGDTITIPSGATIVNSGTQTGFGGTNINLFRAYRNGNQTINHETVTKIQLNAESFDLNSKFDPSTNYRYTPASTGYYYLSATINFTPNDTQYDRLRRAYLHIYKNGSTLVRSNFKRIDTGDPTIRDLTLTINTIDNSTSASDYYEVYAEANNPNGSNNTDVQGGTAYTYFTGYKLIT
jgi:predicted secreted protein